MNFQFQDRKNLSGVFLFLQREDVRYVLRHWYWLALGLAVALFVVWFSFKVKQPEYQQSATLLSRVDASTGITITGSAGSDALDALQNYNAEKGNGNLLDNQMIIQSRRLLSRVVDSLDLRTAYRIRRGLQPQTLWEHRPFTVKIRDGLDLPLTFDAELTKNGKVEIYNFEIDGKPEDVQPLVDMDEPFFTPYGEITIVHADYDQNFVGQRIHVERMTREQAVMHFFRHTTAKIQDDKADLLQVTVTDDNPYRAAAIRDVLIHVFRADVLEYKNIQANQMSRFVNERLDTLGAKLRFIQLAMAEFRKNNQVMAYEENMRHYLSQSTAAEQQRHELETKLAIVNNLKAYLTNHSENPNALLPMHDGMDQNMMLSINAYNTLMTEYLRLYTPEAGASSILQTMEKGLSSRRKTIEMSVNNLVASLQTQIASVKHEYERLRQLMEVRPEGTARYVDLQRQQRVLDDLYMYQLNVREEVNMQLAISVQNMRVVETTQPQNSAPIGPKKRWYTLALLLGLGIPALILKFLSRADWVLHNREEVERYSRLPILGEIPQRSETRQELIISSSGADNVMLEAFRMLRQNLEFVRGHGHVMLITSSTPGQGKSFVSRNLAATCALTGKRVLLIDADIRKLTQSHLAIGTKESTGLTNYLQGGIGPDEIIMKDGLTNGVDFIPGGSVPPNPAELLMRPTLKALLAYVRPRYDYIFIDTTPAFAVADAQTLAHQSDLTLYVVRIGVENRMLLPNLDRIAQEGKFPRMNYVINGVKADYTDYENSGNQNLSQSALLQKLRQWLKRVKSRE
ncbi:MAG: polysaccharide biosynthesis tyrosine autokinase [Bacteroidaceae bacterium]|nr:polysaccharide biosynthesis tyrosine autokinase [Bacteroidaceae bacterium]